MPKTVAECRKRGFPYLYTMRRTIAYAYTLPNVSAYLKTCFTYPNTLTRLSAPNLNTLNRHDSAANQTREPSALGSQSEMSTTSHESSANQTRVLRHPRAPG